MATESVPSCAAMRNRRRLWNSKGRYTNLRSWNRTAWDAQTYGLNKALMNEIEPIRNILGKNIGIDHNDHADDGCQRHRMPGQETEDRSFIPNLIGRGCGNANGLGIDHLTHDAAGAVGRAHQNRAEVELLGGDFLQTAEESIRRSVATGQSYAKPADISAKERKEPAGSSKCQS